MNVQLRTAQPMEPTRFSRHRFRAAEKIVDIPFKKSGNNAPEFQVFELSKLLRSGAHVIMKPHRIEFNQLLLITRGEGEHIVDFQSYPYHPGVLFPVSKGQIQVYRPSANTQGYLIYFTEQYLYRYSTDMEWFFNLHLFNTHFSPSVLDLPADEYEDILWLTRRIKDDLSAGADFARDEIIRNLLKVLILKAERVKRQQSGIVHDVHKDYKIFVDFKDALEKSYTTTRSVRDYADSLYISTKKLNQITHQFLGKTAKEVIADRVVLEIKRMLIHTDSTAKEISFATGFFDPTNMAKFFKRYTRLTPPQFKSEHTPA